MSYPQSFTQHSDQFSMDPFELPLDPHVPPDQQYAEEILYQLSEVLTPELRENRIFLNISHVTKNNYQSLKSWLHKLFYNLLEHPILIEGVNSIIESQQPKARCCVWFTGHYLRNQNQPFQMDVLQLLRGAANN